MDAKKTDGEVRHLSFMVDGKWSPETTGDYSKDAQTGRDCADELISMIERTENPCLFGTVVRGIVESGVYGAVEIGFCSKIGIHLIGLVPAR